MADRDRLIEMIKYAHGICREESCEKCELKKEFGECRMTAIADHLLANGVIVPPDHKTLLWTAEMMLEQWNETTGAIAQHTSWYYELLSILEDTVKLSFGAGILYRDEAEKALKEREGNG
jgi:hypothetical protein